MVKYGLSGISKSEEKTFTRYFAGSPCFIGGKDNPSKKGEKVDWTSYGRELKSGGKNETKNKFSKF